MSVQGVGRASDARAAQATQSDGPPLRGYAVAVVREEGKWRCMSLDKDVLADLDASITALRDIRSPGAVFGLLNVDDEFFVVIRPVPGGVRLLLSDAVAADVLDLLRIEVPTDEEADPWPEGDLGLLEDVGMPEPELGLVVDEVDLYPDEQLEMIASRCGFKAELTSALRTR